jgi:hypothetical protein
MFSPPIGAPAGPPEHSPGYACMVDGALVVKSQPG